MISTSSVMPYCQGEKIGQGEKIEQNGRSDFHHHGLLLAWLVCIMLLLSGCSTLKQVKPQAPEVSIASVRPLNFSLSGQKLNFSLRVKNPNSFDLPVQSLDFVALLAGKKIAEGVNQTSVTIPANDEAIMDVVVVAGLGHLIEKFKSAAASLGGGDAVDLGYGITGSVKLSNWPAKIPFDVVGDLVEDAGLATKPLDN